MIFEEKMLLLYNIWREMSSEMSDLMDENYFYNYILSFIRIDKITRTSQILHVLRGKRTPSMFYLTEINHWHHGFLARQRMERAELKAIINSFIENQLVEKKEKGYLLTEAGKEKVATYFDNHYFPNQITCFSNLSLRDSFWERLQLYTQVFSEYSYENTKYIPAIKDPLHQENVRQLFQAANDKIGIVFDQWVKEQEVLFAQFEEEKADILFNFLTGHKRIGKTRVQLAKEQGMEIEEFNFYLRDLLEELIEKIKSHRKELPLFYKVLKQTNAEVFLGLSQSTYQSYQLLQQGANIQQIANRRYIKENTVKEHILEMAFILDTFPVQYFVPTKIYKYLNEQFDSQKEYSFKQAVTSDETLEFYQYRLVELERMRSK